MEKFDNHKTDFIKNGQTQVRCSSSGSEYCKTTPSILSLKGRDKINQM